MGVERMEGIVSVQTAAFISMVFALAYVFVKVYERKGLKAAIQATAVLLLLFSITAHLLGIDKPTATIKTRFGDIQATAMQLLALTALATLLATTHMKLE